MSSLLTRSTAWIALALGACGNVSSNPPPDGRTVACNGGPVDVLPNGGFDAAEPAWGQQPPNILCGSQRITPHMGTTAACIGGGGDNTTNTLTQTLLLPAGASSARLTGFICIATDETDPVDNDVLTFDILDGVAPIARLGQRSNQQGMPACEFGQFMLEAQLAGDPVSATLRLQSTLNVGNSTTFYVDSLSLTVACN